MTRHKRRRPGLRSLYQWHRYLGLLVVMLIPLLAVSGVLLNHTEELQLDRRELRQPWLLDWYGIAPVEGRYFDTGGQWLSQWNGRLYLDGDGLPFGAGPLVGAVRLPTMIVAATGETLLLLSPEGQLLARLDSLDGLPEGIAALAPGTGNRVLLGTAQGTVEWDLERMAGRPAGSEPAWSQPGSPPQGLRQELEGQHPGPAISAERLILDLHSGRLFGDWGVYLIDLGAGLLLFNAVSGALVWWRRRCQ